MATKQRRDGGFTLIEVLIVIVILGVLATVVVFAVSGTTTDAEDTGCKNDAKVLVTAVEAYFAQHGSGPIPDADGTPDGYEKTMVAEQLMRGPSVFHDLNANGELVPVAGSPCTVGG